VPAGSDPLAPKASAYDLYLRAYEMYQRRFDDPGAGRGHLVLKVENVGERAVKPVGPEMRAARRVDQLRAHAHAAAGPANRARQLSRGTKSSLTLRWRGLDSNF
jgi:hypothetical protein